MKRVDPIKSAFGKNRMGASGTDTATRVCDWPDCDCEGEHRAPKSRDRLNDYYWFCLDHVREYNRNWNYFEGMSDNEFEAMQRSSATWGRPTWPLGRMSGRAAPYRIDNLEEALKAFREDPDVGWREVEETAPAWLNPKLGPEERKNLKLLGLDESATLKDVKKRYKQLVKQYHPDAQGRDAAEDEAAAERLREIIQAYTHLRTCGLLADSE